MDIQDKAFKEWFAQYDNNIEYASEKIAWDAWQSAKAQAVPEGYKVVPVNYECAWCGCTELDGWADETMIEHRSQPMTEYKITNLKDLLNIPVDRVDDCLDELKDGLKLMHAQMAAFEIPVGDAVFDSFTWKDDGAKDMTSNAHFSCGGFVQVKVDRND